MHNLKLQPDKCVFKKGGHLLRS